VSGGRVVVQVVENINSVTVSDENPTVIEIGFAGPQGPQGEPGIGVTDISYVHDQPVAEDVWTIHHGLQFVPNITVVDSGGTVVEGSYDYPESGVVILSFSHPFSGKAYLS
jgi:hypothetical protein